MSIYFYKSRHMETIKTLIKMVVFIAKIVNLRFPRDDLW